MLVNRNQIFVVAQTVASHANYLKPILCHVRSESRSWPPPLDHAPRIEDHHCDYWWSVAIAVRRTTTALRCVNGSAGTFVALVACRCAFRGRSSEWSLGLVAWMLCIK